MFIIKFLKYTLLSIFLLAPIYSQCEYSNLLLTMEDSWGDGWNGNQFCINSECTTLSGGSTGTDEFCVDLSIENTMTCGGGTWQEEVFWSLSDSDGTTLATGGAPFEGCIGGSCEPEVIESFIFNNNGQIREYYLYLPNSIQDNAPLVFVLHGYSGSAGGIMGYSGMNELAAEHGFAVCYPQGLSDEDGFNFWNVGYAFHQNQTVDDVEFLSSLANYLQDEYGLSTENTFSTGMSNGGDMSYMLGCQASDVFKAIAPVAGCMMESIYDTCNPNPIPVLEIHGTNDNVTLWNGDMNNNDGWGSYLSTTDGIDYWVGANECMSSETILMNNVIHHRYFDCIDNVEVWLYEVVGGGHDWPHYANQEIWNFFNLSTSITGDLNQDDDINVLDVVLLTNIILGFTDFNEAGDLNLDGLVNVVDVVLLINLILGT